MRGMFGADRNTGCEMVYPDYGWVNRLRALLEYREDRGMNELSGSSLEAVNNGKQLRSAAVLIGLTGNPAQFILTRRQDQLADHPGEVAFPGGAREASDESAEQNALREASEEIGLAPKCVAVLGRLSPHVTTSGYCVWPVVGWVAEMNLSVAEVCAEEVAEVFCAPSDLFLDDQNWLKRTVNVRGHSYLQWELTYEGRRIWGATAAMLREFLPLFRQALVP